MTEGLQRVAIYPTAGVFSPRFVRVYWHLFRKIYLKSLELGRLGYVSIEVRQCRTAVPHYETALSDESFGAELRAWEGGQLMRVLLDRHAFLGWLVDSERLCGVAYVIADEGNDILVTAASALGPRVPHASDAEATA